MKQLQIAKYTFKQVYNYNNWTGLPVGRIKPKGPGENGMHYKHKTCKF